MLGLSQELSDQLFRRVSATAIANQAILKCSLAGVPLTVDNVIYFVGDFLPPEDDHGDALSLEIMNAISDVLGAQAGDDQFH